MAFSLSLRRGVQLSRCAYSSSSVTFSLKRGLLVARMSSSGSSELEAAAKKVTQLAKDPGNEAKLKLYGLYKQATVGPNNKDKPGMFDLVGKAKWNAWHQLGNMDKSEAVQQYCSMVESLVTAEQSSKGASKETSTAQYQDIVVSDDGGTRTILLNRPSKYNAITFEMYKDVQRSLVAAGEDDSVVCVVLTGAGDYYCSGNDLSSLAQIPPEGHKKMAAEAKDILREFVSAFINFPKPLIAGVNGPAVGISVTLLALCDLVYAADNATFHTPFVSLGQSPEGCSSLLFPRFMGPAQANEMLLAGVKLTSQEAYERGLVTRVYPQAEFHQKLKEAAQHVASLPPKSLQKSKALIRSSLLQQLVSVNNDECELLEERWLSDECAAAIIKFMQRKK